MSFLRDRSPVTPKMTSAARPGDAVHAGPADALETYAAPLSSHIEGQDWTPVHLAWADVQRVAWEEGAGAALAKLSEVQGIAFGVGAPEGFARHGDDLDR